jgi:hypothetical protein
MNQTQVKYARARAESVYKKRKAAIEAKHTVPAVKLTRTEKLFALTAGAFRVDTTYTGYGWSDAVTFPAERDQEVNQVAIDAEQAALADAYRKLEDELVLGDNEQALALLRAFEEAGAVA